MEIALLITAFAFGFASRFIGLPPLVGYLVAGFVLYGLGYETTPAIEAISDLGVLLLLFGIGLKLKLSTLARPEVIVPAGVFAFVGTVLMGAFLLSIGALGMPLARDLDLGSAALVGFAFSFSSTVFAVKALESADDSSSLFGRISIGVLILQDIFAVVFLVFAAGGVPSLWAIPVIGGLILLRPLFRWLLEHVDHGEVQILFGFTLAVAVGAGLFDLVGLKADLGALVAGLLLSGERASEMSDRLLEFKDLFLVGFFLSIGLGGIPSAAAVAIGLLVLLAIPLRTAGLFWLFTRFRLRARTALHSSLTLSTYSEFGLIVGAAALASGLLDQVWVSTIAVAVASSFVIASVANGGRYTIYQRWSETLAAFEQHPTMPEDAIIDVAGACVLVFGMGRIGTGAYDELVLQRGQIVEGVDRSDDVARAQREQGRKVTRGDALDGDFWERVRFHPEIELVVTAMSSHQANLECVRRIREFLPHVRVASIATYADQVEELEEAGVDVARNLYEEAGQGLADDAVSVIWGDDE